MTNIRYPAQSSFDNTAPLALTINSTSPGLKITQTGTGDAFLVEDASPDTSPFVIDSSGRVIIGTTQTLTVAGSHEFQMTGLTGMYLSRFSNDTPSTQITFFKSRNATIGSQTIVNTGDNLGLINFTGSNGTTSLNGARIGVYVDDTPAANAVPSRITLWTANTAANGGSLVERMRIDSSGFVAINRTNDNATSQLHLGQTNGVADSGTICFDEKDTTPASPAAGLRCKMYMKADKFIIQFNEGGTTQYKYLDLTGTTVTWTYTTTAP